MALTATPAFAVVPRVGAVAIAVANTARDGTGTLGTLLTGVAAGTKVQAILCKNTVTTTAGMIRVFLSLDSGATKFLVDEVSIAAATPSATTKGSQTEVLYSNLLLPSNTAILYVSTNNAENCNVFAFGYDLT